MVKAMDLRGAYTPVTYPPVTAELLAEVVRRVLAVGSPVRIVLFGSRARGDCGPDSDLDILILEESAEQLKEKEKRYWQALADVYPEKTVLVRTLKDVEEWKYVPSATITEALAQGKVLYEDTARLKRLSASGGLLVREEEIEYKKPADLASQMFAKGNSDLFNCHTILGTDGPYDSVFFHAQQAVEKYLKAVRAFNGLESRKTHDLNELKDEVVTLVSVPELEGVDLKALTEYAIMRRYEAYFWPDRDEAEEVYKLAARLCEAILAQVPEEARPAGQRPG